MSANIRKCETDVFCQMCSIGTAITGDSPTFMWKTPISIATQMEMTIVDAQQRIGTPRHLVKVILEDPAPLP